MWKQNVKPREHLFLDFKILKGNHKSLMSAIYVYVEIVTIKHLETVLKWFDIHIVWQVTFVK